jgi:hypothetical protein
MAKLRATTMQGDDGFYYQFPGEDPVGPFDHRREAADAARETLKPKRKSKKTDPEPEVDDSSDGDDG